MNALKFVLTVLIFHLFCESGNARQAQKLDGEVVHAETGERIPGTTVFIPELETGVAAGENGYFVFPNLQPGDYEIEIRSVGFKTRKIQINHPGAGFLVVELEPSVIQEKEVIITTSPLGRNIQYQPAQALNSEELQQKAAPSLGEILDGNPGVAMRSFGSAPARPVIRGMDGDRVLVLQNGERMGDMSATAADHAVALDPLAIDRVEVVRGPASLLYGSSALGGVVNLFSYDLPQDWSAGSGGNLVTHLATVNRLGAGLASGHYNTDRFSFSGRAAYREGSNMKTPEGELPGTFLNSYSFGGGAGYRHGEFQTGAALNLMDYKYGLPDDVNNPNSEVEIRLYRLNVQSVSTWKLGGLFDLAELRLQYSEYGHDEVETIRTESDRQQSIDLAFGQTSGSGSLMLRHKSLGPAKGAVGFSTYFSEIKVRGADALSPDAENYSLAGYLFEEITLGNEFSLQGGGRVEKRGMVVKANEIFEDASEFNNRSDLIFSGALGLNYSPNSFWETGFQFARAFRTPTLEELYSDAPHVGAGAYEKGDPNLKNEISRGFDAFLNYTSENLTATVSGFVNLVDHFVKYAPAGEIHQPSGLPVVIYQSADAVLSGFELSAGAAVTSNITGRFELDYVRGNERTGENLPFMTPLRTRFSAMYDNGKWWTGARLRMVNRQHQTAPQEEETNGYFLIGMDGGVRFTENIILSLRVDNLLNTSYRDHLSRVEDRDNPMPGRNFNAMLKWQF